MKYSSVVCNARWGMSRLRLVLSVVETSTQEFIKVIGGAGRVHQGYLCVANSAVNPPLQIINMFGSGIIYQKIDKIDELMMTINQDL